MNHARELDRLSYGIWKAASRICPHKASQLLKRGRREDLLPSRLPLVFTRRTKSLAAPPSLQDLQDRPLTLSGSPAEEIESPTPAKAFRQKSTGAFQKLPTVPSAEEHLGSALKRASRITGNKALKNKAQYARNLAARKLDALTKEIATPLGKVVRGFPSCAHLHPFETALLDLTVGLEPYEQRLSRLDGVRKICLEVGKSFAGRAAKAPSMRGAFEILDEGFDTLKTIYQKGAPSVDAVKEIAKLLRKLPVVSPTVPTIALVGAPNVGKSSLVQLLSSGLPEICDYPFTTRTVKMGHFFVEGTRYQVTDTPGLLDREDADRNAMEMLTLACLEHLPTAVVFVIDLTEGCGMSVAHQWSIRKDLLSRFEGRKLWLDVFSKQDLLENTLFKSLGCSQLNADGGSQLFMTSELGPESSAAETSAAEVLAALPEAHKISATTETGIEELKAAVLSILSIATTSNAAPGSPQT